MPIRVSRGWTKIGSLAAWVPAECAGQELFIDAAGADQRVRLLAGLLVSSAE